MYNHSFIDIGSDDHIAVTHIDRNTFCQTSNHLMNHLVGHHRLENGTVLGFFVCFFFQN